MNNFCTLFNSNYLSRGLALYESLMANDPQAKLYILAFDEECYNLLKSFKLRNVVIISLKEFEDKELLSIKAERSLGEYCWTCTSSLILYVLQKYNLDMCTYLDADLYFFNSPKILLDEIESDSVIITEHRYTEKYNQTETSGKYCVQFMTFKNDQYGIKVLKWWRNKCIEWCFNRIEDGKFGDQKYLDDWPSRFEKIHELKNIGGGVAPWNVQQYKFKEEGKDIQMNINCDNKGCSLIFYHFHQLKIFDKDVINLCTYDINEDTRILIYKKYINHLNCINKKYNLINNIYNNTEKFLSNDLRNLKNEHNYFKKSDFITGKIYM